MDRTYISSGEFASNAGGIMAQTAEASSESFDGNYIEKNVRISVAKDTTYERKFLNNSRGNAEYFLRWSRLSKVVHVKDVNNGLVHRSIAGEPSTNKRRNISQFKARSKMKNERRERSKNKKIILNSVSGFASPGQVLALIGPSGSGKTSLLNVLSGRTDITTGEISVNGKIISNPNDHCCMKGFLSQVAYVEQNDIFFDHLTVRDQLTYTAFLRLPQNFSRAYKLREVEHIIRLLHLSKVQKSQIKLLSGGEKKRVTIGTELLTNPSCLLLDEPTSGLDSTSAVALVRLVQKLAISKHKTILMSIHQPSSAIFMNFDSLLLLAEGNVVYFGSPSSAIKYLQDRDLACPAGYNAADHWMDLLVSDESVDEEEADSIAFSCFAKTSEIESSNLRSAMSSSVLARNQVGGSHGLNTRQILISMWDGEVVANGIDQFQAQHSHEELRMPKKYKTSWLEQYRILFHRALKNSRSAIFTPLNMIRSAIVGLMSGLLWFQLDYTEETVHDRSSYIFFTMAYWVFDSMFGALMAFPAERKVVLKERSSASYHLSAYFMGKTTSEAPTRLVLPLLYMTISFWLAGISDRFSVFLSTTIVSLLSVLAGESYGLLVGASVDDMDSAMTIITVVALAMMLLGGFYVENMPKFMAWAKYLSPFKYAFDASRILIFDLAVPCDGSGELQDLCSKGQETVSPEDLDDFFDIDGSLWFNIGMLIVLGIVPRYFAYFALKSIKCERW